MKATILKRYDINGAFTHDFDVRIGELKDSDLSNSMWRVHKVFDLELDEKKITSSKDELVNTLTCLDTSSYRCVGHVKTGRFTHEPPRFRNRLAKVYNKLDEKDLNELLTIRKHEEKI